MNLDVYLIEKWEGGVYTEKYLSFESRHYLAKNITVYWIFLWCFLIGVTKLKVNKE